MTYKLYFTGEAKKDLARLKKNEPAAFKKAKVLLKELQEHPGTGTGKPKPLGYGYKGFFFTEDQPKTPACLFHQ